MSARKHQPTPNRRIIVHGVKKDPPDLPRLARALIQEVKEMTPQQRAELERRYRQLKYQDYLQVIHDYVHREDRAA
jgi:ABC-type transporter MlaC component